MSTFRGSSCTSSKRRSRVRERWPSAMATTSKARSSPEANRTVACASPASTASIRSPKRYSAPALRSCRRPASWPRRISSSAVGPSSPSCSKDAADSPSASTNSVPVSVVLRARISSSIPSRRAASRPAPRTSTFWPSSRSRSSRSTTVTSHPASTSQQASAGPAMPAPEIRMRWAMPLVRARVGAGPVAPAGPELTTGRSGPRRAQAHGRHRASVSAGCRRSRAGRRRS